MSVVVINLSFSCADISILKALFFWKKNSNLSYSCGKPPHLTPRQVKWEYSTPLNMVNFYHKHILINLIYKILKYEV